METKKTTNKIKQYWRMLGPGLTTGAADDDPAGIVTYTQAGAGHGFQMLWTSFLTFPLMSVTQEMCARIGLVTGRGLAGVIRRHSSKPVLYIITLLLFVANTFNIGADLGMMVNSSQLLMPTLNPVLLLVFFAAASLWMQIVLSYKEYAKYLKWLALILFAYVFSALSMDINWSEAIKLTFIPDLTFSKESVLIIAAILGTTISPYLFFWQTSQEVEEQILEGKTSLKLRERETTPQEIKKMRVDVWSGMFLSNLVMFFIMAAAAATLYKEGIFSITDAAQAASALKPFAGNAAYLLFAMGIIGTGLLAVPVLAGSSSYAISESFGWKEGLYRKFKQAHAFYGIIIFSMVIGFFINFLNVDPVKMLIYSAVLNACIAPLILAQIVILSSNKKLMKNNVSKPLVRFLGWLVTTLMTAVAILTVWFLIRG